MLWNLSINGAGSEYDPLTLLRSRTMYGRPNWKQIYGRIRDAIETGAYVERENGTDVKVGVSTLERVYPYRAALLIVFAWN
jgi:NADPH oxidase 1